MAVGENRKVRVSDSQRFLPVERVRIANAAIDENLTLEGTKMFLLSIVVSHENYRSAYDSLLKEAMAMRERLRCPKSILKNTYCGECYECSAIYSFDKWLEENKP